MCCPTTTPTITTITKRKGKIVKRRNDLHKHIVKVNITQVEMQQTVRSTP